MADTKISALGAIPVLDVADVLPIVDDTDTTTKNVSIAQLDGRYLAGGTSGTMLNAADYGLSIAGTPAANTTALKACVNAAVAAQRAVFIPAGIYEVADNCLTPTLGSAGLGINFYGDGDSISVLQMERGNGASHFFDNSSGSNTDVTAATGNSDTLRHVHFIDIGFQGGPVETSAQRSDTNEDCLGFRLFGAADQNFRFTRCRFQTMKGVWHSWGHNNASEIAFSDCKIKHISGWVVRSDNLQALNYYFRNCDVEIVWGNMFQFEDTAYGAQGGGGQVGVFGGSWIIQDDGASSGTIVKVLNGVAVSSVISFFGSRIEVRNDATVIDGSAGGLLTVNFNGCNIYTVENTGAIRTVDITTNQFVGFTRCTFEHNGSYATYNVQGTAWLIFDQCAVRGSLASEITTAASATTKAINCRERSAYSNAIDFTE